VHCAALAVAQHLDLDVAGLLEVFLDIDVAIAEGGLGVRIDSALYAGYRIPPYYDSLIGKLIVFGKSRTECLMRLKRALGEYVIEGVETTIPLFQRLLAEPDIIDGHYDIHWLEHFLARSE
jgi:acetyl-CoA carboxylase biotin carboxylase subunit